MKTVLNRKKKLEYIKIDDLIFYERNARTHSDEQINQIINSITEFGFTNPVLIDEDNVLIAGHGRTVAAGILNMQEVPAIRLTGLSEAQRKALRIADNQLALNAGWDEELLRIELEDLKVDDFDLSLIGFNFDELEDLINAPEMTYQEESVIEEDNVPGPPEKPISKQGDIWILGNHRLMCGDSTSIDDVQKLMNGQKADMVFTDPPYRMEVEGGSNQWVGKAAKKLGNEIKDLCNFDPGAFLEILPTCFLNKMNAYIFCNKDLIPDYLNWAIENKYSFNVLFWKKPNAIPLGEQHRPDVEYIIFIRKNATWNNGVLNVNYSKCLEFGRDNSTPHPTMKPVELITNEVRISSNKKDVVLDLFGGSGSTLIACEQLNRKCYMMEIEEHYCDVIIKRWQELTGKQAFRDDGATFDDLGVS